MPPTRTFEDTARERRALEILTSPEHLTWHANAAHDSLAHTALHFERAFYGLPPPRQAPPHDPLFTDAGADDRLPDAVDALLQRFMNGDFKAAEEDAGDAEAKPEAQAEPDRRRDKDKQRERRHLGHAKRASTSGASHAASLQQRPHPRTHAADGAGASSARTATAAATEQISPASARSRRARSERSSGGSQSANAKKRARKSLGGRDDGIGGGSAGAGPSGAA